MDRGGVAGLRVDVAELERGEVEVGEIENVDFTGGGGGVGDVFDRADF